MGLHLILLLTLILSILKNSEVSDSKNEDVEDKAIIPPHIGFFSKEDENNSTAKINLDTVISQIVGDTKGNKGDLVEIETIVRLNEGDGK